MAPFYIGAVIPTVFQLLDSFAIFVGVFTLLLSLRSRAPNAFKLYLAFMGAATLSVGLAGLLTHNTGVW